MGETRCRGPTLCRGDPGQVGVDDFPPRKAEGGLFLKLL